MFKINQSELNKYFKNGGSPDLLSTLGKDEKFAEALNSDIGRALLADAATSGERLLQKIVNETATDKDRADYRAYRDILLSWALRIARKDENEKKVMEKINGRK